MRERRKLQALILLGIAVVAIVALSAGLSDLELRPGQPFSWPFLGERPPAEPGQYGALPGGELALALIRGLIILFALLVPLIVVLAIISPNFRKRVLQRLISFILLLVSLYALMRLRPDIFGIAEEMRFPDESMQTESLPAVPAIDLSADPPWWLTPVTGLCLALPLAALFVGIGARLLSRRDRRAASPLTQLAQEAEDAIERLRAGGDLRNTVIRCYAEMARVLDERRGIRRQRSMTTREFEEHLELLGLPDEPVHRLTRLFEEVRYGANVPGEREEHQAITSLTAIVEACKGSA